MTEPDYDVVERFNLDAFIVDCRRKVREGWVPLGGIAHSATQGDREYYVQAFYKPAKQDEGRQVAEQQFPEVI